MTRRRFLGPAFLALLVGGFVFAPAAVAQTGAEWPQYQGGPAHPGVAPGPEPGYAVAWELAVPPGGPGDRFGLSAPVIHDGVVIAVGPEQILAVDLASGDEVWTSPRELGPSVPGAVAGPGGDPVFVFTEGWGDGPAPAPGASPTTSASPSPTTSAEPVPGSPTPGSDDTFAGPSRLVAIPVGGGEPRWSVDLPDVSRTGVLVTGSLAVVGTNDGTVTAVDVRSGEVAWTAEAGRAIDVTPASDGETVVVPVLGSETTGPIVLGFSAADGSERWRFAPASAAFVASPPAIAGELAFVGFSDRAVFAIDLETGAERWRAVLNAAPAFSPPVPGADAVYVLDAGARESQLSALDPSTGAARWDHAFADPVLRVPALALGDAVVTGTIGGDVVAFDAASGDEVFRAGGEGPIRALASDGETLVAVRGGAGAGLLAYRNDPTLPLTQIVTPTALDPALFIGAWIAASIVVLAVAWAFGRILDRRLGLPVFVTDDAPDDLEDDA